MENLIENEWKMKPLNEILNQEELLIVFDLIKKKGYPQLKVFLNSIDSKLKEKGIVADYLYYVLLNKFKDFDFIIDKEKN